MTVSARNSGPVLWLGVALLLSACGTTTSRAPVEDRRTNYSRPAIETAAPVARSAMPGADNAGKPGYYTVRPGDTLIRIGLETGQNWKDLARWNSLGQPNQIEVGQVLRVVPPVAAGSTTEASAGSPAVVSRPVTSGSVAATQVQPGQPSLPAVRPAASAASSASSASSASAPSGGVAASGAADADAALSWGWPSAGPVIAGFDEVKNKGVDLSGAAGDPVLAAADGRVVYVGAGLRGYGNLIILKHDSNYLTAYAHNQTLLVKEDQSVHKGQKIAEMGNSDADRVKLHFEVRKQGKPVDPVKYLPPR